MSDEYRAVWKFPLAVTDRQSIMVPGGSLMPLSIQVQPGSGPCLWAQVNPKLPKEPVDLVTVGTGHLYRADMGLYIDTYQLDGGALVFHVFRALLP